MTWPTGLEPVAVQLVNRRSETGDTSTYLFSLPPGPGRNYRCQPGQFNMLSVPGVGEAPISVSGFDAERGLLSHTIRHVGNVTHSLAALEIGQTIGLRGPYGRGWPLRLAAGRHLVFLAGGIGLAPLMPAIEQAWHHRDRCLGLEVLVGSRTPAERLFSEQLARWKSEGLLIRQAVDLIPAGDSWSDHVGFVTDLLPSIGANPEGVLVMACGPEPMLRAASRVLHTWGLPVEQLYVSLERRMKCGFGTCGHCQIGPYFVCKDGPVFNQASLENLPIPV